MNWSLLDSNRELIDELFYQWVDLIQQNAHERVYHDFLREHANLFLLRSRYSYLVISKLKLGSDYEVDFAVPEEAHSVGLIWNLIEIEKPQDAPYTQDGNPSAALSRATQQIRDWKLWLREHNSLARRLFSVLGVRSERAPNFKFTIIIGTRENSAKWLDKRNQYAMENGIEIRSFDYLGDVLRERRFRNKAHLGSGNWENENPELSSRLVNPFMMALGDSDWKKLLYEPHASSPHFYASAAMYLDFYWQENKELRLKFEKCRSALSAQKWS